MTWEDQESGLPRADPWSLKLMAQVPVAQDSSVQISPRANGKSLLSTTHPTQHIPKNLALKLGPWVSSMNF